MAAHGFAESKPAMSRASQKSRLSPSITKDSNRIDLGKNSGVDMGQKSEPSLTSGGIGITQEVTNIGGMSVSAGANIDITPLDFGISVDPSEGTVSLATGAEVPGGLLGISGGITIDTNTGEIIGGSIGGEALGLGVNISNSKKGGLGIEFTVQIPGTPIELSLGLSFPPDPSPTPTPSPTPGGGGIDLPNTDEVGWVIFNMEERYYVGKHLKYTITMTRTASQIEEKNRSSGQLPFFLTSQSDLGSFGNYTILKNTAIHHSQTYYTSSNDIPSISTAISASQPYPINTYYFWYVAGFYGKVKNIKLFIEQAAKNSDAGIAARLAGDDYSGGRSYYYYIPNRFIPLNPPPPPPPPFPNPPPRKRDMNECCRESVKLQRAIFWHLGVGRSSGQENLPAGVKEIGSTREGIRQAYPFVVRKRWIDPNAKENEGIPILNDRQLALVLGGMIERLEKVLGTAEFYKDPDGKLRQSEGNMLSWLTGKNKDFQYPDPNDFWVNSDDGIINEKLLEVRSIAEGVRYQIEALNRLERILPIAELKDSSLPKRWIYPGAKGQERVGNLIHLVELMVRADDKHRGYWPVKVKVKDADPAIKGDQPVELEFHSQADVFRELFQYLIDMEGDGDLTSNFALRSAFQQCQIHQLSVKNNAMLDAIVEYLDFKVKQTKAVVPMPFDPFAGVDRNDADVILQGLGLIEGVGLTPKIDSNKEADIEALAPNVLRNTYIDVDIVEYEENKTLNEALLELLKHSSAASAAVSERVSESAIDRVVEGAGLAQKVAAFLLRRDVAKALGIGDLDKWVNSAELGYTDLPESDGLRFPESDPQQPYGRPTTENPRIREIDTKEPQAD